MISIHYRQATNRIVAPGSLAIIASALAAITLLTGPFGRLEPCANPRDTVPNTPIVVGDVQYAAVDPGTGSLTPLQLSIPIRDLTISRTGTAFYCSNAQFDPVNGGLAVGHITTSGTKLTHLTKGRNDYAPVPSRDEMKLAFIRDHQVAVMDLRTRSVRIIAPVPAELQNRSPIYCLGWCDCAWTPDERSLICSWQDPYNLDHPRTLWRIPLDRTVPVKLLGNACGPRINPKDNTIAFLREAKDSLEVWTATLSTSGRLTQLRRLPISPTSNVAWSPDGTSLAYLRHSDGPSNELWLYSVIDNTNRQIATSEEAIRGYVSW